MNAQPEQKYALVVLVDASQARFLNFYSSEKRLTERACLVNEAARVPEQALASDRAGRAFDSVGEARHHVAQASRRKEQLRRFVKQVAHEVNMKVESHAVTRVILVAAPSVLGLLRTALGKSSRALLVAEVPKDYAKLSEDEILVRLADELTRGIPL
ncbi:MAG: host attachment protein [Pseudomonadota bacterium]